MKQPSNHAPKGLLKYIQGDATLPGGSNMRYILQIVTDSGKYSDVFNKELSTRWPKVESLYKNWWRSCYGKLNLGEIQVIQVLSDLAVINMVAQHDDTNLISIDFKALQLCLSKVGEEVSQYNASIHIPKIILGLDIESWELIEPLIDQELLKRGINITVYDIP